MPEHTTTHATKNDPLAGLPALISVGQTAAILGLTRPTAYRYAQQGYLPVRRFGPRRVLVITAKLRPLLEAD